MVTCEDQAEQGSVEGRVQCRRVSVHGGHLGQVCLQPRPEGVEWQGVAAGQTTAEWAAGEQEASGAGGQEQRSRIHRGLDLKI